MSSFEEEQILKKEGWKLHHKDGGTKFWQSPYAEHRLFSTQFALIVETQETERKQDERNAKALDHLERMRLSEITNEDIDQSFPPVKKVKRPKTKKARKQTIKDLGFRD